MDRNEDDAAADDEPKERTVSVVARKRPTGKSIQRPKIVGCERFCETKNLIGKIGRMIM